MQPPADVHLRLTQDKYDTLMFIIGYAIGSARKDKNPRLKDWGMELKETIEKQVPRWIE